MSSTEPVERDTGLLRVDEGTMSEMDNNRVFVKNTRTDDVEPARVTESGIVRENNGSAAYSIGEYELFTTDPEHGVVVSSHSNRCSFHTANCRSIKRGKKSKRKIIEIDQAIGFYDLRHCHSCSEMDHADHSELQQLVKYDYTQN